MQAIWSWILAHPLEALGALGGFVTGAWALIEFHFRMRHSVEDHGRRLRELEMLMAKHLDEVEPVRLEFERVKTELAGAIGTLDELKDETTSNRSELLVAIEKSEARIMEGVARLRGRYHEVEEVAKHLSDFQSAILGKITELADGVLGEARRIVAAAKLGTDP